MIVFEKLEETTPEGGVAIFMPGNWNSPKEKMRRVVDGIMKGQNPVVRGKGKDSR